MTILETTTTSDGDTTRPRDDDERHKRRWLETLATTATLNHALTIAALDASNDDKDDGD